MSCWASAIIPLTRIGTVRSARISPSFAAFSFVGAETLGAGGSDRLVAIVHARCCNFGQHESDAETDQKRRDRIAPNQVSDILRHPAQAFFLKVAATGFQ